MFSALISFLFRSIINIILLLIIIIVVVVVIVGSSGGGGSSRDLLGSLYHQSSEA